MRSGTVRGHLAGAGPKRLLIGSHIDTVVDAGRYDGIFGVVAGILAARHIARSGTPLPFSLDVLAFGDEEGSRFPTTLASSAAVAGIFDPARLAQAGIDGVTLRDAIRAYGKNPDDVAAAAYRRGDVAAYVEVHIEQGPVLEAGNQPLGVVTAIAGPDLSHRRVRRRSGPCRHRADAAAARRAGGRVRDGAVCRTRCARISRRGGGDGRPDDDDAECRERHSGECHVHARPAHHVGSKRAARSPNASAPKRAGVAERRQLGLAITQTRDTPTTPCDIRACRMALPRPPRRSASRRRDLPSGAGHDGQAMSKLCPVGMLFVRCRGGVSHNPAEYASPPDMGIAVAALIEFISST